jgi:hypothetical protein
VVEVARPAMPRRPCHQTWECKRSPDHSACLLRDAERRFRRASCARCQVDAALSRRACSDGRHAVRRGGVRFRKLGRAICPMHAAGGN